LPTPAAAAFRTMPEPEPDPLSTMSAVHAIRTTTDATTSTWPAVPGVLRPSRPLGDLVVPLDGHLSLLHRFRKRLQRLRS